MVKKVKFQSWALICLIMASIVCVYLVSAIPEAKAQTVTASFYPVEDGLLKSTATGDYAYTTCHDAITGTVDSSNSINSIGQFKAGSGGFEPPFTTTWSIYRSGFTFDTSSIPDNANITAANLKLFIASDTYTTFYATIIVSNDGATPHYPLQASDYNIANYNLTSCGAGLSTSAAQGSYWTIDFTNLTPVSVDATTNFVLMSSQDIAAQAPLAPIEMLSFYSDNSENKPILEVTYTVPEINTQPPTISSVIANTSCTFSTNWTSTPNALDSYIFSTNNTGEWVNETATAFTTGWANVTQTLTEIVGQTVGYQWFVYDSLGNWNSTEILTLTTKGYTLTPSSDEHSTISPDTPQTVCAGASLNFSFSAEGGFSIENVIINGSYSAPTTSPYSFINIQGNQTISISTGTGVYFINATSDDGSVITYYDNPIDDLISVPEGNWANFTCTPKATFLIYDLAVNGSSIGPVAGYNFIPTGNATLYLSSISSIAPFSGGGGTVITVTEAPTAQPTTAQAAFKSGEFNFFFVIGVILIVLIFGVVVYSKGASNKVQQMQAWE